MAFSYQGNNIRYKQMTIGDTVAHPEFEVELEDAKPYDWQNKPAPKVVQNFKIETPPASAQNEPEVPQDPQPFSFGFQSMAKDGMQSREESQDASGKVTGSYSITGADGTTRIVEYYADETGFHANIKSNEPGLEEGSLGAATVTKL